MIHYSFFESIIGKIKQKRKYIREPQIPENIKASWKRYKQYVVHGMVNISLESKTGGFLIENVKKNINNTIAVSPWMIDDILKCASRRHTHKIRNNKLLDK